MERLLSGYSSDRLSELPIFVLKLERSSVRRQSAQSQLEALRMADKIVPAADRQSLSQYQLAKYLETQAMQVI